MFLIDVTDYVQQPDTPSSQQPSPRDRVCDNSGKEDDELEVAKWTQSKIHFKLADLIRVRLGFRFGPKETEI